MGSNSLRNFKAQNGSCMFFWVERGTRKTFPGKILRWVIKQRGELKVWLQCYVQIRVIKVSVKIWSTLSLYSTSIKSLLFTIDYFSFYFFLWNLFKHSHGFFKWVTFYTLLTQKLLNQVWKLSPSLKLSFNGALGYRSWMFGFIDDTWRLHKWKCAFFQ